MHSGGQSGLPFSAHYRDFVARWAKVEYVPLWATRGAAGHAHARAGAVAERFSSFQSV